MLAAIGWGAALREIGGIAAAIGLGALFGLPYCIAFAVTVALPAWWLGHLVVLGRPVASMTSRGRAAPPSPNSNGIRSAASCCGSRRFAAADHDRRLLTLGATRAISGTLKRA